jgi:hypothetical protein
MVFVKIWLLYSVGGKQKPHRKGEKTMTKKELLELAEKAGCEVQFEQEPIDENHLSSLWYGGSVATVKFPNGVIGCVDAIGDVYATLTDLTDEHEIAYVKDKGNNGNFYCEMSPYIKNDEDLRRKEAEGELLFDNNNWWEISVIDKDGEWHDLMWASDCDDLYGAIEECIVGLVGDEEYESGFVNL